MNPGPTFSCLSLLQNTDHIKTSGGSMHRNEYFDPFNVFETQILLLVLPGRHSAFSMVCTATK
jgi:hypothetical protein